MAKEIKKDILIGVIFPSIVGIILMLVEPTREFLFKIAKIAWNFVVFIIKSIFEYLSSNHQINGFLLVLLVLLSGTFIILFILYIIESIKEKTFKDYKEDKFYGLKWRWNWGHSGIENLWCFCPICDFELTYDDNSTHRYSHDNNPRTDFICDHCQRVVGSVKNHDKDFIIGIIEREIRRKIRNNLHINENKNA